MNLPPLPELPETYGQLPRKAGPADLAGASRFLYVGGFTADQLRAYALAYGRAVQEACAEACESLNPKPATMSGILERASIAAAIRKG